MPEEFAPSPRVLTFDLSLTSTGVCLPDGTTTKLAHPKLPKNPSHADNRGRLVWLRDQITTLTSETRADVVIIEGMSYGSKGSTIDQTFGFAWIVRLAMHDLEQPYAIVPPSSLKLYALGKGSGAGTDKDAMGIAAMKRAGLDFSGRNDECDAWWLWCMSMDAYGAPVLAMPANHRAALEVIEWPELATTNGAVA